MCDGRRVHVRVHHESREALFAPEATTGSPDADKLAEERLTEVVYQDGTSETIRDRWQILPAIALLAKSGLVV